MRTLVLALTVLSVSADPQPSKDADAQRFARWEKEVSAIEKRLADDPPKPGCVIFAGSSSVRQWDLKKSFPGAGYVNVGFGGSQIPDCTHFVGRLIAPHKPRAVVLYAGDNDSGAVRLKVKPADASVYVDGFYVGIVDDFDGAFQRLKLEPGPHKIEIRAQQHQPLAVDVMIQEDFTITYRGELGKP